MDFIIFLLIIHSLMLPVGIVYLLMSGFTKDNDKKASYASIGKKIFIAYSILLGLFILVGLGLCFAIFNDFSP